MAKYFPRPVGGRINWNGLSDFKLTWKVSKAAIVYRAHQLGLLTDEQYKTAFVGLKRKGEAIDEKEDHLIPHEQPALFRQALMFLIEELGYDMKGIAEELEIEVDILYELVGDALSPDDMQSEASNVVSLQSYRMIRE